MRHRTVAFIVAALAVLAACGPRVDPLSVGDTTGGPLGPGAVNPTAAPGEQATQGPQGVATAGPAGPGGPQGAILPNCSGGATDTGVTGSTIKLGLIATLTGAISGQFDSAVQAVDSYFRAVNDAGGICGRKIELLIRDDNGNGANNLTIAKKMVEEQKIFAFVGSTSAPDDSGIAKVSKKYRVPDIGFPLTWERAENPYAYGVPGQLQRRTIGEGASGSMYLNRVNGIKQVAIFWMKESEVSILNAWAFEAAMIKTSGGKIRICHEQPTGVLDNNFVNYVVRMQGKCDPANGPIAVYSTMENKSNIKLARDMRGQEFKPKLFAPTFASYQPSFINDAQGATEGAYIAMPQIPFERLSLPRSQWSKGTFELERYVTTLRKYYKRPAPFGSFGAPGWAMAALFVEVAKRCGAQLTRACVFKELNTMEPFSANGFVTPTRPSDHRIYTADLIVQVRNGRFTEIKPPQTSGPPGGPDFWDRSKIMNWWDYYCANKSKFPNTEEKDDLYLGEYCDNR